MDYLAQVASTTDTLATSFFALFNDMIPVLVEVVLPIGIFVGLVMAAWSKLSQLVHPYGV